MHCILGAIMYCSAAMAIPGPLASASTYTANEAWRYATYYQPAVIAQAMVTPARRG